MWPDSDEGNDQTTRLGLLTFGILIVLHLFILNNSDPIAAFPKTPFRGASD